MKRGSNCFSLTLKGIEINFSQSADVLATADIPSGDPGVGRKLLGVYANAHFKVAVVMTDPGVYVRSEDTLSPSVRLLITRLSEPLQQSFASLPSEKRKHTLIYMVGI